MDPESDGRGRVLCQADRLGVLHGGVVPLHDLADGHEKLGEHVAQDRLVEPAKLPPRVDRMLILHFDDRQALFGGDEDERVGLAKAGLPVYIVPEGDPRTLDIELAIELFEMLVGLLLILHPLGAPSAIPSGPNE